MVDMNVNMWAVLVAALASLVLGGLWYSPLLFGKQWMALMGIKMPSKKERDAMKNKMMGFYFAQFLASAVMFYVLSCFMHSTNMVSITGGMQVAFLAWLGFIATLSLSSVFWEGRPFKLWVLNNAYNIVTLLIGGIILGAWA